MNVKVSDGVRAVEFDFYAPDRAWKVTRGSAVLGNASGTISAGLETLRRAWDSIVAIGGTVSFVEEPEPVHRYVCRGIYDGNRETCDFKTNDARFAIEHAIATNHHMRIW